MILRATALAALALHVALPLRAWAQAYQCEATDGDSLSCLELGPVRIAGMDAPETRLSQTCQYRLGRGSADWEMARGQMATEALQGLLESAGGWVRLEPLDAQDRYQRTLAAVFVGDVSVAAFMIHGGWAVAYDGGLRDHWCEP